ncbi:fungal-specific transcription factor domain-domain-containing protein [Naematelia encephala]|uniref:Fungal-specific transcription factor domain-domain-containing protein n=1 Tax=Naematelia encephala TaxID=71784 RepID=A0A1Y2AX79_9TREE|nr:fungal-specific transcription factor domain-domain-containing protein [Naematelia encephala]
MDEISPFSFRDLSFPVDTPVEPAGPVVSTSDSEPSPVAKKRRRASGDKRERCANACNRCKAKKLKCFQGEGSDGSCARCAKSSAECVFENPVAKHAGGEKYILALESRVAKLESALAQLDPDHPEINDHYDPRPSQSPALTKKTLDEDSGQIKLGSELLLVEGSAFRFAKILKSSLRNPKIAPPKLGDRSTSLQLSPPVRISINPNPSPPRAELGEEIFRAVYMHVQARYGFVEWDRLRAWHERRDVICSAGADAPMDDQVGAFSLWVLYAIGVTFTRDQSLESAETYLEQAMRYTDAVIAPHDLTTVRALLMLIFFAFRATSAPSIWHLCGFAMRLCVELGLHRKAAPNVAPITHELRKRVFWSAYCFDRLICLSSGRPFNLSDRDIDVELPVDVDWDCRDSNLIASLQQNAKTGGAIPYTITGIVTTMSSAIHTTRLYVTRSRIQTSFYSIHATSPRREEVEGFLQEMEEWKRTIPKPTAGDIPAQPDFKFTMIYFEAVLYILRPSVLRASPRDPLLMLCATAAAETCELVRKVSQAPHTKHTIVSIYNFFGCGMTLLYCLSVLPSVIPHRTSSRALRACSSTLAIYAQLFPAAVPFRELFEHMTDEVMGDYGPGASSTTSAIADMLVGNFDGLSAIYETIHPQPSTPIPILASQQPQADPPKPDIPLVNTMPAAPFAPLPFDFAALQNFSDLASLLDIPADTPGTGWTPDWDSWTK